MGRALVVGARGQVGRQLMHLLGENHAIAAVRRDPAQGELKLDLETLAVGPATGRLDLPRDVSAVFCVGAATDVERCEADPTWAMNTNCFGPLALARALPEVPFVLFSTDYVFDGADGPYRETDATHALSVYGESKLRAEQMLAQVHPKLLILRTNVVYGPDPAGRNFLYTLRRVIGAGQRMRVMSDQISTPTYNTDLAQAAVALTSAGATGVFHVSGPEAVSRYTFAQEAARILGLDDSLISPVSTLELQQKAARPLRGGLLNERLSATLPQQQMRGISEGVSDWISEDTQTTRPV